MPICRRAEEHFTVSADFLALLSAGSRIEMSSAMIPMTTSNSTSVNPDEPRRRRAPSPPRRVKERAHICDLPVIPEVSPDPSMAGRREAVGARGGGYHIADGTNRDERQL